MAFIKTIAEEQADGLVQDQYQAAQASMGYVPNYIKAFSLRPEVYDAWTKLIVGTAFRMKKSSMWFWQAQPAISSARLSTQ